MAVIPFVKQTWNGDGDLYKAETITAGDESSVLTFPEGQVDISVQIYGTIGGSTITVQGSLVGTQFNVVDDAYGVAMSYTSLTNVLKPVGPALSALKIVSTGGAGVDVDIDAKVVRRVRP